MSYAQTLQEIGANADAEIGACAEAIAAAEAEADLATSKAELAEQRVAELTEQLADLHQATAAEISALNQRVSGLTQERDALLAGKAALDAKIASLTVDLANAQAEIDALKAQSSYLKVGTTVSNLKGETKQQAYDRRVRDLGEPEAVRVYNALGDNPSWPEYGKAVEVVSFKYNAAGVLAGQYDAQLRSFFSNTPRNGKEHIWCYWHEVEDDIASGALTALQYRQVTAYIGKIEDEYANEFNKLRQAQILMSYSLQKGSGRTIANYVVPDTEYAGVDYLGWDCYPASEAEAVTRYNACMAVNKTYAIKGMICETGLNANAGPFTAEQHAAFIDSSTRLAAKIGFEYYLYFDSIDKANLLLDTQVEKDAMRAAITRNLPLGV